MKNITDQWLPSKEFDNVLFSIFFDDQSGSGISYLPLLNAQMPKQQRWQMAHAVYGWGNTVYSWHDAQQYRQGRKVGYAPTVNVNKAENTISLRYKASAMGFDDWQGVRLYISTWDITGEGMLRGISPDGGRWSFGGANPDAPRIMDDITLSVSGEE